MILSRVLSCKFYKKRNSKYLFHRNYPGDCFCRYSVLVLISYLTLKLQCIKSLLKATNIFKSTYAWKVGPKLVISPTDIAICNSEQILNADFSILGYIWLFLIFLNPFVPNAPFFYPLKTKVFLCFPGV